MYRLAVLLIALLALVASGCVGFHLDETHYGVAYFSMSFTHEPTDQEIEAEVRRMFPKVWDRYRVTEIVHYETFEDVAFNFFGSPVSFQWLVMGELRYNSPKDGDK